MLSGETAAGAYPVEAARMMDTIVRQTEAQVFARTEFGAFDQHTPSLGLEQHTATTESALARAAALLSRELDPRCIVVLTQGGLSMAVLSASRPAAPLVAVTREPVVFALGCLAWGVVPVLSEVEGRPEDAARRIVRELEIATDGQSLLLVRGFGSGEPSVTVLRL
jgi:pyruvate kinase